MTHENQLHCTARGEIINLSQCEGPVIKMILPDKTKTPLCIKHADLYDAEPKETPTIPDAQNPQNSQ